MNAAPRLYAVDAHDDGINAWRMERRRTASGLGLGARGYCDYSEVTRGFTTRRELPHDGAVLIFNLGEPIALTGAAGGTITVRAGEGFVAGAHLSAAFSRSAGSQAGVQVDLPLEALHRLTGVPMAELRDASVPLHGLPAPWARGLGERLGNARSGDERADILDAALGAALAPSPLPPASAEALRLLRDRPDMDIAAVAAALGWSRKRLAAETHRLIGIGPRSYRRLLRFSRLVARLGEPATGWADRAFAAGYADQPHMIREFREFAGITPGAHAERRLGNSVIEA